MRTTLTLDPDVAVKLRKTMVAKKLSFKEAVNQALRAGLDADSAPGRIRFRVEPHNCRFKPGIDLDKLNQLVDKLEVEEFLRKLQR